MAAPAAMAQQAYAYNNPFTDNTGLTLNGLWAVDSTPAIGANAAPAASNGNSLNWNNGVDFSGATITGTARTPTIDMTGVNTATMTFYCWYNTRRRHLRPEVDPDLQRHNNTRVFAQQSTGLLRRGNCAGLSSWHRHSWATSAALNIPIIIGFFFNAVDRGGSNGPGLVRRRPHHHLRRHASAAVDDLGLGSDASRMRAELDGPL
jgi:hypothetical protein